ncbi:MAG: hypothetical protein ACOCXG_03405 [Nanoarchaeota archaeon]
MKGADNSDFEDSGELYEYVRKNGLEAEMDRLMDYYVGIACDPNKALKKEEERLLKITLLGYNYESAKNIARHVFPENVEVVSDPATLLRVFKIRRRVYSNEGYQEIFGGGFPSFEVDDFDLDSLHLFTMRKKRITASARIIKDTYQYKNYEENFKTEYRLEDFQGKKAEWSRYVSVSPGGDGLDIFASLYNLSKYVLGYTWVFFESIDRHYKKYSKFGNIHLISRGKFGGKGPFWNLSAWNISEEPSDYFFNLFGERIQRH